MFWFFFGCSNDVPLEDSSEPTAASSKTGPCPGGTLFDEERQGCHPEAAVTVSARDGVGLWTKVFLPAQVPAEGVPVLLQRSPYLSIDSILEGDSERARFHTSRGFAYVLQSVRGRYRSDGVFEPNLALNEIQDGQDTTSWIVEQPWSNQRIATIGCSYDGFTAVAAAVNNPHVAAVIEDDSIEDLRSQVQGGAVSLWYLAWRHAGDLAAWPNVSQYTQATNTLDAGGVDQLLLGTSDPYWQMVVQAEVPGSLPDTHSLAPHYGDMCAPHLSIRSKPLNDGINISAGVQAEGCEEARPSHRLFLTPDGHCAHSSLLGVEETPVNEAILGFIDEHLLGVSPMDDPGVQFSMAQGESYQHASDWPPTSEVVAYYLDNPTGDIQNALLRTTLPATEQQDVLVVDPAEMDPCGSTYPYAAYASSPLEGDVKVGGAAKVVLALKSSAPDGDVFATLYEYAPSSGDLTTVAAGSMRLRYREGDDPKPMTPETSVVVELPLSDAAHHFSDGSLIILLLAGGQCGALENPQTGEPLNAQTTQQRAELQFLLGPESGSRLELPIIH